jgi:hypothetical protein
VGQNIESEIGAYLRSELIPSLITVIILDIDYQLIGLKYPVLLAAISAVGWLLVWFGGLLAVVPALLSYPDASSYCTNRPLKRTSLFNTDENQRTVGTAGSRNYQSHSSIRQTDRQDEPGRIIY